MVAEPCKSRIVFAFRLYIRVDDYLFDFVFSCSAKRAKIVFDISIGFYNLSVLCCIILYRGCLCFYHICPVFEQDAYNTVLILCIERCIFFPYIFFRIYRFARAVGGSIPSCKGTVFFLGHKAAAAA